MSDLYIPLAIANIILLFGVFAVTWAYTKRPHDGP